MSQESWAECVLYRCSKQWSFGNKGKQLLGLDCCRSLVWWRIRAAQQSWVCFIAFFISCRAQVFHFAHFKWAWSRETFYLLFIVIYYFTTIYCQGECHHLKQNKKHHPDSSPGRGCTWARITPGHVLFVSLAVSHPSSTADVLVYKGKAVLQNKSFQWKHKSATNATSNGLCITPYLLCPLSVPLYPAHFHTNQADVWTRK